MTKVAKTLQRLEQFGKASAAAIYKRHGVCEETYGVSYSDFDKLVRRIGVDHELALDLWDSGIHDARVLATRNEEKHFCVHRRTASSRTMRAFVEWFVRS